MVSKYGSLDVAKLLLQRQAPPDSAGKVVLQRIYEYDDRIFNHLNRSFYEDAGSV